MKNWYVDETSEGQIKSTEENDRLKIAMEDWQSLTVRERCFCHHVKKHSFESAINKYGEFDHIDPIGFGFLIMDLSGNVSTSEKLDLVIELEMPIVKFGDTIEQEMKYGSFDNIGSVDLEKDTKEAIAMIKRGLDILSRK